MIAHFHDRQRTGDIRCRNAQQLRLFELAYRLQLLLFIIDRDAHQILAQLVAIGVGGGRLIERGGIEQLIQQQRIARQLAGDHWRRRAQADQVPQGAVIFGKKLQVGAAREHAQQ